MACWPASVTTIKLGCVAESLRRRGFESHRCHYYFGCFVDLVGVQKDFRINVTGKGYLHTFRLGLTHLEFVGVFVMINLQLDGYLGSVAEWSQALVLGTSLFGGVGSNLTTAINILDVLLKSRCCWCLTN